MRVSDREGRGENWKKNGSEAREEEHVLFMAGLHEVRSAHNWPFSPRRSLHHRFCLLPGAARSNLAQRDLCGRVCSRHKEKGAHG